MKRFRAIVFFLLITIGYISMMGCGEVVEPPEEVKPAAYKSVKPAEGTEITVDASIHIEFDSPPEEVRVSAGNAITVDTIVKISGGFDPGPLKLEVIWRNATAGAAGKKLLAYTVIAPDIEKEVLIPAGEFQMGSDDEDADPDEQPVHAVYVDAFYMDAYEVTNVAYQQFLLENPQWQKGRISEARFHDGGYLKE